MLAWVVRGAWLLAVMAYLVVWFGGIHPWYLEICLPGLMALLSFAVFNRVPGPFRLAHHLFVGLLLLASLAGAVAFAFYGGDQGGIGSYLLLYYSGVVYLCFVAAFMAVLWLARGRMRHPFR